jgi:hypothetical protein
MLLAEHFEVAPHIWQLIDQLIRVLDDGTWQDSYSRYASVLIERQRQSLYTADDLITRWRNHLPQSIREPSPT